MTRKVAVIVGSLRAGSVNRQLAEALGRLARPRLDLQVVEIADLPLYNQDLEASLPASVARFKRQIEGADAVLFVTPEFNRSFSAALKNAIEWGSRPWGRNSWAGKPGAIIGATPGAVGTAAAQSQLRSVVSAIGMALTAQPEVYVNFAMASSSKARSRTRASRPCWTAGLLGSRSGSIACIRLRPPPRVETRKRDSRNAVVSRSEERPDHVSDRRPMR